MNLVWVVMMSGGMDIVVLNVPAIWSTSEVPTPLEFVIERHIPKALVKLDLVIPSVARFAEDTVYEACVSVLGQIEALAKLMPVRIPDGPIR